MSRPRNRRVGGPSFRGPRLPSGSKGRGTVRHTTPGSVNVGTLCVPGCVPGEASEPARAGPRDPTRFAITPWQVWMGTHTSEHGPGLSSQRPRVQVPSTQGRGERSALTRTGAALTTRTSARWLTTRPNVAAVSVMENEPLWTVFAEAIAGSRPGTAFPEMGGQTGASPQSKTIPTGHNPSQGARRTRSDGTPRPARDSGVWRGKELVDRGRIELPTPGFSAPAPGGDPRSPPAGIRVNPASWAPPRRGDTADISRSRPHVPPKSRPSFGATPGMFNPGRAPNPATIQARNDDLGATWADRGTQIVK